MTSFTSFHLLRILASKGEKLYDGIAFHTFELGKFPIKKSEKHLVVSDLDKLMYTMKYAHSIKKDKKSRPDFFEEDWLAEPLAALNLANLPFEKFLAIRQALVDEYLFQASMARQKAEAKAEGMAEGKAEGEAKKQTEVVLKFHDRGFDHDFISDFTGLSKKEIQRIIRSRKNGKS